MTATFASMYCPTDSSESPGSVDLLLPSLASCSPEDILADLDLSLSLSTLEPSLPAGSGPTTDLVLSHLPSPPLLQNLVDLYAFHVHPFLPMADLPALRHALISPPWPFPIDFALLLHSIYALGWCFVGRSEADGARESADNFAKCKELLERLQGKHTLRSLQGLANMCLYTAQSSGIGLEVADMYLAQAICAARHLGVDRRPLLTDLDPSTRDRVHSFWSLFLLDKYMAVNKTRLPMISEDEAEYMQQYPLTHDLLVPLHIAFSLCHTMQLRPPADPSSYITRIRRTLEQARPYLTQPDQLRVCRNVLYCVAAVRSGFEPGDVVARYLGPAMRDAVQCADSSGYVTLGSPFANFGVLFLLKLGLRLGIATEPDLCAGAAALSGHGVRWRTSAGLVRDLMGVWMGAKAVEAGVGNGNGPAQLEGTSTSVESSEGEERLVAV
ncbi:hypothetical protein M427DRAFT_137467 [Gonapodya prolifera JEL478]|uniref:Xylanolytic transcriptional activator regulatory domain-containing protein n=1 Tax=Gonapodya prolifera (strain JEL478) TaxID=1344416 RepID=A0A139A710_GONPJ|nr:hypothetical protein M427DRAFT_137467 [Gonapodya prolifera JEL478]|eukprot:KXS12245.1 hypothetical protein M427DRAFT_137467 [Gonapodya prolifera JEL478]